MNLLPVLRSISDQISTLTSERTSKIIAIQEEYRIKIDELKTAYKVTEKMNTACTYCNGKGYIDAGRNIREYCSICNGIGTI